MILGVNNWGCGIKGHSFGTLKEYDWVQISERINMKRVK